MTQRILGPLDLTRKPAGHWTIDGSKNIKKFLDDLAASWERDPLDPETWYGFNLEELTKAKVCWEWVRSGWGVGEDSERGR